MCVCESDGYITLADAFDVWSQTERNDGFIVLRTLSLLTKKKKEKEWVREEKDEAL